MFLCLDFLRYLTLCTGIFIPPSPKQPRITPGSSFWTPPGIEPRGVAAAGKAPSIYHREQGAGKPSDENNMFFFNVLIYLLMRVRINLGLLLAPTGLLLAPTGCC